MDNDFHKRLLATFRDETKERLAAISAGLIALEKSAEPEKRSVLMETVFREAHSLKGAARAVNMAGIESLCHALEGIFSGLQRRNIPPSPDLFDLLHHTTDVIEKQFLPDESGVESTHGTLLGELLARLEQAVKDPSPVFPPSQPANHQEAPPPEGAVVSDTVRISAARLDALLHQTEEMLTLKQAVQQRLYELGEVRGGLAAWEKEWRKVKPGLRRPGTVSAAPVVAAESSQAEKLLAFCEWSHGAVKALERRVQTLAKALSGDRSTLGGMVDGLVDDLKGVLMLPCATVLGVLPKMVRNMAREEGKEVELLIAGETVEVDKRIMEEMKDPLIHLVRNCIDHGIERPEERRRRNKAPAGQISVTVSLKDASLIEITVADDGRGIDTAAVATAAVRQGALSREQVGQMERNELLGLVFASGISTAPLITDISGRGLGLPIVRERVEKLGGTVTVTSEARRGTTFRMVLPLTLSTCRGVLVEAGGQTFVVPAAGVERVARVAGETLRTVENRETVEVGGAALSYVRLADVLRLPAAAGSGGDAGRLALLVIASGASRIAFGVDTILDEQEVLVKNLGPQLQRVRNIAAATVLGTGRVVAILHPGDLVKSAVSGALGAAAAPPAPETVRRSVLVVEDSITARTLLKNILETTGYRTFTAVDGIDALTRLRTDEIDLVVSDVDMPRMNGFELTAKIRASREFADLPVVLVTSLDSRADRERGVEAGANAYIVKSSFDQSNLLDVIKRLV
ncbi:MAG TPA: response regulator [Desulfuromonadaceae bacterium]